MCLLHPSNGFGPVTFKEGKTLFSFLVFTILKSIIEFWKEKAKAVSRVFRESQTFLVCFRQCQVLEKLSCLKFIFRLLPIQEAQIEDYFKPIDKQAGTVMEVQLESEKKTMGTMMNATQEETIRKIEEAERLARANATAETNMGEKIQDSESSANEKAQAK